MILENIDRQIATDQVDWDLTMRVFNYQRDLTEQEIGQLKSDFLDNLANQKIINDENQLTNSQLFQQIDERDVLIANLKFQIEELKRILEEQKEENLAIAEEFGLFAGEAKDSYLEFCHRILAFFFQHYRLRRVYMAFIYYFFTFST